MSWEEIAVFGLALVPMLIGFLGCFLPGIPGTPLVLLGPLIYYWYFSFWEEGFWVFMGLVLLTLTSLIMDFLATMIGAKKMGATWKGITGAVVGGAIGFFFSLPGIILGPFLGALLFEWIGSWNFVQAGKAGLGAVLGIILGGFGKILCSSIMIVLFCGQVLWAAWN